jgi:hypothetical protein
LSTCTDLINAINAIVVDPNLIVSFDTSTVAALSTGNTTETAFSLSGGGPFVCSIPVSPSINGRLILVTFAGKVHSVAGHCGYGLYLGNSATLASDQQIFGPIGGSGGTDSNFFGSYCCLWDSVSQTLTFAGVGGDAQAGGAGTSNNTAITGVTSQTNIQFVLSGKFSSANAANSTTLTQFKLSFV